MPCVVTCNTVNVKIFVQYIFSRILRRALDAQKFDVSENYNQYRTNRIKWYVREKFNHANMPPGAWCAKI